MAFDLASLMSDVSRVGTDSPVLQQIPLEQIRPNGKNFYAVDNWETDLAESIKVTGLLDPLIVYKAADIPARIAELRG